MTAGGKTADKPPEENVRVEEARVLRLMACKAARDRLRELEDELRARFVPRPRAAEARRPKAYLAGPMRGRPYYNFRAFDAARDELTARGWDVVSPADLDRERGFDALRLPPGTDWSRIPEGFDMEACIKRDVKAILRCDVLVFLPGHWEGSAGCKGEFAVALWAGKPVYQLSRDGQLTRVRAGVEVAAEPAEARPRRCPCTEPGGPE